MTGGQSNGQKLWNNLNIVDKLGREGLFFCAGANNTQAKAVHYVRQRDFFSPIVFNGRACEEYNTFGE